jgi:hypothetical protein
MQEQPAMSKYPVETFLVQGRAKVTAEDEAATR